MPKRESPLWRQFEDFLETQSQACRIIERLGLTTLETQAGGDLRMNAPDASQKITTYQTAEHNSAFNAEHGHAGTTLTENRETKGLPVGFKSRIKKEGRRSSYWTDNNIVQTLQDGGERFTTDVWSMWPGGASRGQTSLF